MASQTVAPVTLSGSFRPLIVVLSVALHAVALILFLTRMPAPAPVQAPGQPMKVIIAPVATTQAVAAGAPQTVSSVTAPPSAAPPPAAAQPVMATPAAPPPGVSPATVASEVPPIASQVAIPADPPPQKPIVKPAVEAPRQVPRPARQQPRPERQVRRQTPPQDVPTTPSPQTSTAPAEGSSGAQVTSTSPVRGDPHAEANYAANLLAWLRANQNYPRQARLRHIEGTVTVYFRIDRSGRVLNARIVNSSGSDMLDEEAMAMLSRTSPPVPTADVPDSALANQVPIRFTLR